MRIVRSHKIHLVWAILCLSLIWGCGSDDMKGFNPFFKGSGTIITQVREELDFNGIYLQDSIPVYVYQADTFGVRLKGDDNIIPEVTFSNQQGILYIFYKDKTKRYAPTELSVHISAPKWLSFNLNGGADIIAKNELKTKELTLVHTGSGTMALKGSCETVIVQMQGSGSIRNYTLETEDYAVVLRGSGFLECRVSHSLNTSISGSGSVYYLGDPKVLEIRTGSGKTIKKG